MNVHKSKAYGYKKKVFCNNREDVQSNLFHSRNKRSFKTETRKTRLYYFIIHETLLKKFRGLNFFSLTSLRK